jgi:hypothetical protein
VIAQSWSKAHVNVDISNVHCVIYESSETKDGERKVEVKVIQQDLSEDKLIEEIVELEKEREKKKKPFSVSTNCIRMFNPFRYVFIHCLNVLFPLIE